MSATKPVMSTRATMLATVGGSVIAACVIGFGTQQIFIEGWRSRVDTILDHNARELQEIKISIDQLGKQVVMTREQLLERLKVNGK